MASVYILALSSSGGLFVLLSACLIAVLCLASLVVNAGRTLEAFERDHGCNSDCGVIDSCDFRRTAETMNAEAPQWPPR
jgi:hypothetical protein